LRQLGTNELSRGRLLQNDLQPLVAIKRTRLSQHVLVAIVVLVRVELEFTVLNFPAGKAAGELLNVLLAVVAHSQTKQLHHLAGKVLVGMNLAVGCRIKIQQHGGVASDPAHQLAEATERMLPQQLVLLEHELRVTHLGCAGGKVSVPKQRCLLQQRRGRMTHPVQPPTGQQFRIVRRECELGELSHFIVKDAVFVSSVQQPFDCFLRTKPDGLVQFERARGKTGTPK
jgi:hypothetical protein